MNLIVTHFYRRRPDPEGWIQTIFVTRRENEKGWFLSSGNSRLNEEKIREDLENGSLLRLPVSYTIQKGESVWIASDQSVYIANTINPSYGDITKIYQETFLAPYDLIEEVIKSVISDNPSDKVDDRLETYLSFEYWKILLSILIKWIKNGFIIERNFGEFGYLFNKMENIYEEEFTKLMNQYNMALLGGWLGFEDSRGFFKRWEIEMVDENLQDYVAVAAFKEEEADMRIPVFEESGV